MNMKGTGIIRRIDDLGRIVITKEIRRKLDIHEGDPLECFLGDDYVAFKKYNPVRTVRSCLEALHEAVLEEPYLKNTDALLEKIRELTELLNAPAGGVK